ncbi:MAG: hypothetical protein J6K32_03730 [Clostridia bacterium]|nr:hypothetical protein [Clostridia bacterium]
MYNNVGEEMMSLATVCCWIIIAAFAVIGLLMLVGGEILMGLIVAGTGAFVGWASGLALYGFGQLITETEQNGKRLDAILSCLQQGERRAEAPAPAEKQSIAAEASAAATVPAAAAEERTRRRQQPQTAGNEARMVLVDGSEKEVRCPYCGQVQRADRDLCFRCAAPFVHKP